MILCLVTDRRRLGVALGLQPADYIHALHDQVAAAAEVGIDFVQIREADLEARELTSLVRSLIARCHGSPTKILVNDRLDVALAAGAAGVHLKENSFEPAVARRLGPAGFIVTAAVHTPLTATARQTADLLIAGTVLPTVSKSPADYLEWKGLKKVIGAANGTPVLGIGGLNLDSLPLLAATGAAGLAGIGGFIPESGASGLTEFVKKRVTDMRFVFDSAPTDP